MTGLVWLCKRETLRVSKLWTQTVLAPVVSSMLFILVFGLSLGGRIIARDSAHGLRAAYAADSLAAVYVKAMAPAP